MRKKIGPGEISMRALDVGLLTISWQACLQEEPPLAQVLAAGPLKQGRRGETDTIFKRFRISNVMLAAL